MSTLLLYFLLAQPDQSAREERIRQLTSQIAESGRILLDAKPADRLADPRRTIAPGAPP